MVAQEGDPAIPVWIDVLDPTPQELNGLAENYQLHPNLVIDSMQPEHLPKHEKYEDTTFIIIRHFDSACRTTDDSVQSMTSKLALFIGDRFLISIHRRGQVFLDQVFSRYGRSKEPLYLQVVLLDLLREAVNTYQRPLEEMENMIHRFETSILTTEESMAHWEEVFRTKCRLTTIKRILWHTQDTVQKFAPFSEANLPFRQDLLERIDNLRFFSESLLDDLTTLLNIQMSLATHRANEASNRMNQVMKVLTIFSAFFLPLNFIVGVYGMNFEFMPELKFKYGYFGVWGILILTVAGIYRWFVSKGWIRWGHLS